MKAKLAGMARRGWPLLVLLAVVAGGAVFWMMRQRGVPLDVPIGLVSSEDALRASGIIQAQGVNIASEYGGRIAELPVTEGDHVTAGQPLVRIDSEFLDAQIEAGQATLAVAQASLAQAQAGSRRTKIVVAEAQLAQAQAAQAAAQQAVTATQALVANPQDINLKIAVLEAQQASLEHQLAAAVARKDASEELMNKGEDVADILARYPFSFLEEPSAALRLTYIAYWQGWIGVNATTEGMQGLQATLANLQAQQKNPQDLVSKLDEAKASLAQADAQVQAAQAQLSGMEAGASPEQLAAVEARVTQAQTALDALQRQRDRREIAAPAGGTVVDIVSHPGEVAAAGATILTIANIDEVTLQVYVPETEIGRVQLGQAVQVTVDGLPGRVFAGEVSHIAGQAEFTPRNVATKEERANLVFAVEIRIASDDGALKAGMPADAVFAGE